MTVPSTSADASGQLTGVTRRHFLRQAGSALVGITAAGVWNTMHLDRVLAHDDASPSGSSTLPAWAASKYEDGYLALATDGVPGLFALKVGSNSVLTLGSRIAFLPDSFAAHTILAIGGRILLGGSVVEKVGEITLDNLLSSYPVGDQDTIPTGLPLELDVVSIVAIRPALFELTNDDLLTELSVDFMPGRPFGEALAISSSSPQNVSVLVAGSDSAEMAYGDALDLVESQDGGTTWVSTTLVSSLGEADHGYLSPVGNGLLAFIADGDSQRHSFYRAGAKDEPWLPSSEGRGQLLAVSPIPDGSVAVITSVPGQLVEALRWRPNEGLLHDQFLELAGDEVHGVLGVAGATSEVILVGAKTTVLAAIG